MKSKRKNNEVSSETTQSSNLLKLSCLFASALLTIPVIILISATVITIESIVYVRRSVPIVEQSVIEQCNIQNYQATGSFNYSPYDYYDSQLSSDLLIICRKDFPNWDCTCEEQGND